MPMSKNMSKGLPEARAIQKHVSRAQGPRRTIQKHVQAVQGIQKHVQLSQIAKMINSMCGNPN